MKSCGRGPGRNPLASYRAARIAVPGAVRGVPCDAVQCMRTAGAHPAGARRAGLPLQPRGRPHVFTVMVAATLDFPDAWPENSFGWGAAQPLLPQHSDAAPLRRLLLEVVPEALKARRPARSARALAPRCVPRARLAARRTTEWYCCRKATAVCTALQLSLLASTARCARLHTRKARLPLARLPPYPNPQARHPLYSDHPQGVLRGGRARPRAPAGLQT